MKKIIKKLDNLIFKKLNDEVDDFNEEEAKKHLKFSIKLMLIFTFVYIFNGILLCI